MTEDDAGSEGATPGADGSILIEPRLLANALRNSLERRQVAVDVFEVVASGDREALERARSRGADLLLHVDLQGPPRFRFDGNNGWFAPNLALWVSVGLPSLWIRDRIYTISWDAELRVTGTASGRAVARNALKVRRTLPLNVIERGWSWRTFFTPPGYYEGTRTGTFLAELAEDRLVVDTGNFLESFVDASAPVTVTLRPPGARLSHKTRGLELQTERRLQRLRIEVDGRPLWEHDANPLTLPAPTTATSEDGRRGFRYFVALEAEALRSLLDDPDRPFLLRVYARVASESAQPARTWSVTQTYPASLAVDSRLEPISRSEADGVARIPAD